MTLWQMRPAKDSVFNCRLTSVLGKTQIIVGNSDEDLEGFSFIKDDLTLA
jgi:hypothetical protein